MNCPNCNTANEKNGPGEYCAACGTELIAPTGPVVVGPQEPVVAGPSPVISVGPALFTLAHQGGKNYPLQEGSNFLIARDDTDKCQPDLLLPSPGNKVSSAPVTFSVQNGKAKFSVDPKGTMVLVGKLVHPGDSLDLGPGDTVMLGEHTFSIG